MSTLFYSSKQGLRVALVGISLLALCVLAGCNSRMKETAHGVVVKVTGEARLVRLEVVNDDVIRVSATAGKIFSKRQSLMANYTYPTEKTWTVAKRDDGAVELATPALRAIVQTDGTVSFTDADGHPILAEQGRTLTPMADPQADKQGHHKRAYTLRQLWRSGEEEAFYGLGQHQSDEFNYRDLNENLFQYNTKVTVPMIVSTKGYGILWDNYSESRWGDARPYARLNEVFTLYDKDGHKGTLTGTWTNSRRDINDVNTLIRQEPFLNFDNEQNNKRYLPQFPLDGAKVVFEGELAAKESGIHRFLLYYAGYTRVFLGGDEVVADRWRTAWNPNSFKFAFPLEAGKRVPLRIEWEPDGGSSYCALTALTPRPADEENAIAFWSEMGDEIDYYFIASGAYPQPLSKGKGAPLLQEGVGEASPIDRVISGYRAVTGKAPVMPRWAMGFWQCRERYKTADEILSVVSELRRRQMPVDVIVQDWFYWQEDQWGSHEFDRVRYPDPRAMIDSIHAMNTRYMISVWPKFYANTEHFREFDERGWMYRRAVEDSIRDWVGRGYVGSFYDAYSPGARQLFWKQMNDHLYSRYPIDAWWMDASEPNVRDCQEMPYLKALCGPTELGSSTEYLMAYGLMNADAIYNGQRSVNPNTRVFLLTRNGYAGLQRYSTAIWSGDIGTRWEDLKAQISAGINFCMSGIPFWGMDSGGFCTEKRYERAWNHYQQTGEETDDLREWRELQARWFQVDAFVPLFRVHGQYPFREVWYTAPEGHPAYQSMLYYDRLRYRLMPYIYSLNGWAHFADYTLMRGLPMDFTADARTYGVSDQFMFGPSLMVCPVYTYGARQREVYFPENKGGWYDFYTSLHASAGGERNLVDAPYERIPLYVPAGAILLTGPDMQYSNEKPLSELRIDVYAGRDGRFTLYEDEGTTYDYERGFCSFIPIAYDDAARILSLGKRSGSFPEMVAEKNVRIVLHTPDGTSHEATADYKGEEIVVKI
jgi:Alpha-glucosidases, family 31 of glycosyl hydrolases